MRPRDPQPPPVSFAFVGRTRDGGRVAAKDAVGRYGERVAVGYLTALGMQLIDRNWRCPAGEIDAILRDGDTIVFVEVKAREGRAFGTPAEAVSTAKQRRIAQLAMMFLTRNRLVNCRCRFDVVSVDVGPAAPIVQVFQNAFDAAAS